MKPPPGINHNKTEMTTNQKKAALRKIGITFHTLSGTVIRCEASDQMGAIIEHQMHWSVDSIAKAVGQTWEMPIVQEKLSKGVK